MSKRGQMCYIMRRDAALTVGAAVLRPTDPTQLLLPQHAANLRRGNVSVTVSASQRLSTSSPPSVLHSRSSTLEEGWFRSRKRTSTSCVKPWRRKRQPTHTGDSAATKPLCVCFSERGRIATPAAASSGTNSTLHVLLERSTSPHRFYLHFCLPLAQKDLSSPQAAGSDLGMWCSDVSTLNIQL